MSNTYFWCKEQVICVDHGLYTAKAKKLKLNRLPCIDTNCLEPDMRYGKFLSGGWVPIPYGRMPKKFLTHVLLLT